MFNNHTEMDDYIKPMKTTNIFSCQSLKLLSQVKGWKELPSQVTNNILLCLVENDFRQYLYATQVASGTFVIE